MEVKDGAKQFVGSSGGNAGNKMEFIGFQSIIYFSFNTIRGRVDFRQVEPRGDGGEVEEKLLFFKFINNWIVIQSSQHLVKQQGQLVRSLWPAAHSWMPRVAFSLVVGLGLESESRPEKTASQFVPPSSIRRMTWRSSSYPARFLCDCRFFKRSHKW